MPEPPERADGRPLGRYQIRRRLGAGGFARVYLAYDPDLDFEVAVKVLKAQYADDPQAVERFRREATTAVRLRHPNVVTVLAVGRLDEPFDGAPASAPYLVMDFLPDSLANRLATTPVLPEYEVRRVGADVARGLAYAHAAGVVHRDVKPDNILFGRDGQAVVTDFGIARAVADTLAPATRSAVVGTPSYFSPEQARGLPLDGRTDVYALGVTLYQMATGTLPFTGDDWYAVMRQHVEDDPVPPRARNASLSAELDATILRCLAKAPERRFASAAELADALARPILPPGLAEFRDADPGAPTVVVDPLRHSGRLPGAAATRSPARSERKWLLLGGAVGVTAAAAALALTIRSLAADDLATFPGPADSSLIATFPDSAADSLAVPNGLLTDSTPRLAARGALDVSAPGAEIRVNGIAVGSGAWRTDTLPSGRYEVRARVVSVAGCPTADTDTTVALVGGERRTLRLRPRGCGSLAIVATPTPADYTLTPAAGGRAYEGRLPLAQPLVLPAGTWRLSVTSGMCAPYGGDVTIAPGGAATKPVKLIC